MRQTSLLQRDLQNVNQVIDICINYFKTQLSKLMGNWQVMDSTNCYYNTQLYFVLNKEKNYIGRIWRG